MIKILLCCTLLVALSCKDPAKTEGCTPMSDPDAAIELISPVAGSYSVGSTVHVQWKVNPQVVDMVTLAVLSGGAPCNIIKPMTVPLPEEGNLVCMDTSWVIGSERDGCTYATNQTVRIRVAWYGRESLASDESGLITINNP